MSPNDINTSKRKLVAPVSAKVDRLRISFHSFARKSAKCVLGMAETVTKAKRLTPAEFSNFCDLVDLDPSSSRIRKLIVIGNNLDKLKKHLKALPPNWTTIYEIAQMDDDLIVRLIHGGVLTPVSTAVSLATHTPPTVKKKLKRGSGSKSVSNGIATQDNLESFLELDGSEVVAHFDDWLDADKLRVLTTACDSLRSIGAEIHLGVGIEEMIDCAVDGESDSHAIEVENVVR